MTKPISLVLTCDVTYGVHITGIKKMYENFVMFCLIDIYPVQLNNLDFKRVLNIKYCKCT